ncbi:unnamed protein product [Rotaria sordida]|uniref:NADAR domain-containing protein n=1 Tax=Rotaria sordida TaxID=392033 RepID=A0A819UHJ3_9BILA|nr:unnamed protein product [Rotaria sordida]CAF4095054.1 unnamed protein product [Rotaria sordida]
MAHAPIYFYDLDEPYGEFSNFYAAPIELDGYIWPTSEHYFQAQKFIFHERHFKHILKLATPREIFDYAQAHKSLVRPDWPDIKNEVMYKACKAKFTQHWKLKQLLLSTGHRTLVEHTKNDSYWGDGGDGTGKNQLGTTLMHIKGVFDRLNNLIHQIQFDQTQRQHYKFDEPLSIGIFNLNAREEGQSSTKLNDEFIHYQLLIDCILQMESSSNEKQELIALFKQQYKNNPIELKLLKNLKMAIHQIDQYGGIQDNHLFIDY